MALSNKFGGLLLTTGNKSEYAVGYATIYGDMCGGYAPIKDLYKTEVYALANWRNAVAGTAADSIRPIPQAVIDRAPSANCARTGPTRIRCPPTACSTAILYRHVDQGAVARRDRARAGFSAEVVDHVLRLVRLNEWKATPGRAEGEKCRGARVRSRTPLSDHLRLALKKRVRKRRVIFRVATIFATAASKPCMGDGTPTGRKSAQRFCVIGDQSRNRHRARNPPEPARHPHAACRVARRGPGDARTRTRRPRPAGHRISRAEEPRQATAGRRTAIPRDPRTRARHAGDPAYGMDASRDRGRTRQGRPRRTTSRNRGTTASSLAARSRTCSNSARRRTR